MDYPGLLTQSNLSRNMKLARFLSEPSQIPSNKTKLFPYKPPFKLVLRTKNQPPDQ